MLWYVLTSIENRRVGVADGIGSGVHPSAHDDPLPKVLEDGAVILHFQVGFLRGGVRDVEAEIVPPEPGAEGGCRTAPAGNKHLPAFPGGIGSHRVRIWGRIIETP